MPEKELVFKVIAMPRDTNPDGDIFGGWILSQMDLSAYVHARKLTRNKLVTVAMDQIIFHRPVFVGDCLVCYAMTEKTGRTSVTVKIEAMVERKKNGAFEQVTEGRVTLVAVGEDRKPVPLTDIPADDNG